jgi:hypothetical protein
MSALYESIIDDLLQLIDDDIAHLKQYKEERKVFEPIFERKVADKESVAIDADTLNNIARSEKEIINGLAKLKKRIQDCEHRIASTGVFGGTGPEGRKTRITDFDPSLFKQHDMGNTKEETDSDRGASV